MPDAPLPGQGPAQNGAIHTDALVVGAGPVGLFQVFQLGLQGISAQVIDALPVPGGQCIELYPDKPIYDIPGLPVCTGRELVDRLRLQVRPFAPAFHLGQTVASLQVQADGRWLAGSSSGVQVLARSVFIAAGVGAFQARTLKVAGAERHAGRQLHYQPPKQSLAGQQVLVLGGDDAALQAAVDLATLQPGQRPARIGLLHRRATLSATPALRQQWQALLQQGAVHFEVGQILSLDSKGTDADRLVAVQIVGEDGAVRRLPVDTLLAFLGLSPKLGPLAQWGLALQRRQLVVDAASFETSLPGIHAVGDVVTYPGKKKLILCGFHEATLATFAALQRLRPDAPAQLQYTTTSALLQQRLGVAVEPTAAPGAGDPDH